MKLSIITVNLNNKPGLERTFHSVFSQTYQDFEYVVIDGGSTDGSKELIEAHSDKIHYWVSEPDKGIFNAMNKGIKVANGEYLLFLNSGDYLTCENILSLCLELKCFEDKIDIIYGNNYAIYQKKNTIIRKKTTYNNEVRLSFFYHNSFCHPSTFIRRESFNKVGYYDENLKIVSDWKFFLEGIFKHQLSTQHINLFVSNFMKDGLSSHNKISLINEKKIVLKENFHQGILKDIEALIELEGYSKKYGFINFLNFLKEIKSFRLVNI